MKDITLDDLKTCYRVITNLMEDKHTRPGDIQQLRVVQNRLANAITNKIL